MRPRHFEKIKVSKKAKPISYYLDGNIRHGVREWAVTISITSKKGNGTSTTDNKDFTYNDLLRLRRVVNRAIKIVKNPKKHENNQ